MLKSSRQPYQATTVRTTQETSYTLRNPWIDKHAAAHQDFVESSTNSSSASRGFQRSVPGPPPASEWLRPFSRPHTMSHMGPLLNQVPVVSVAPSSRAPTTQGSSPVISHSGGVDGCGGQCIACDTFCYYCLQVVFIVGILTGISLTIAGSVLRGNSKGGDLMVLIYIGFLLSSVSTLLLSVHCCVRRNVKQRKQLLRLSRVRPPTCDIPLQDFQTSSHVETEMRHGQRQIGPTHSRTLQDRQRRFYLADERLPEWERQPYQPLMHRPPIQMDDEYIR